MLKPLFKFWLKLFDQIVKLFLDVLLSLFQKQLILIKVPETGTLNSFATSGNTQEGNCGQQTGARNY